jgi:hypothetical protein
MIFGRDDNEGDGFVNDSDSGSARMLAFSSATETGRAGGGSVSASKDSIFKSRVDNTAVVSARDNWIFRT